MSGRLPRVVVTGYAGWFAAGLGAVRLGPGYTLRREAQSPGQPELVEVVSETLGNRWPYEPERVGLCFSSSKGRLGRWTVDSCCLDWTADVPGAEIARAFPIAGPYFSPNAACASGTHAIALGAQLIQDGRADMVIAGAEEPAVPGAVLAGYRQVGALSKSGLMRPFDRRRDGFVPNSGAAVLILENGDLAAERGAQVHGAITGWSLMADATHMTAMDVSGRTIAAAVRNALRMAGEPAIDYVNAHGTATHLNDLTEARALRAVLPRDTSVSGTKGWTGHLLGAAGALEAVICLMAMRGSFAPSTLNLEEPDEECFLLHVPRAGLEKDIGACLTVNYGFGGHIGALVLERKVHPRAPESRRD